MSIKFSFSEAELADLMTRQDLSDVIADIDVTCYRLDFYQKDEWWDHITGRRKLTHPAITQWMAFYGFDKFSDLPSGAIRAMSFSLKSYVERIEKGLPASQLSIEPTEVVAQ
ncbi:MAG: hypothetical protein AB8B99_02935 [Phormidesmis sp.]